MWARFETPLRTYRLTVTPLTCNRFGLAEFLTRNLAAFPALPTRRVLDVGCGVGPIGLYFADCLKSHVTGVELNPQACDCCRANLARLGLGDRFALWQGDFGDFAAKTPEARFDLIVSNPPIDTNVPSATIQHFARHDCMRLDNETFAYLTNAWHQPDGMDLADLTFAYARHHLAPNGAVLLVFCALGCDDPAFVEQKAKSAGLLCAKAIRGAVTPESIGFHAPSAAPIPTFMMAFRPA